MINKALDLPFDEPLETYSSSEHFFHDMGIAPGTKGRLVPEGTIERKPRPERGDKRAGDRGGRDRKGGRDGGARPSRSRADSAPRSTSGEAESTPARKRNRSRRRTRGGSAAGGGTPSE
jgi:hypothetical protein